LIQNEDRENTTFCIDRSKTQQYVARPREFDPVQALRDATFVFWRNGYEQTTIRELAAAMGIGLPSLYATFGSKRRLFEHAVALYMSTPEYLITSNIERQPAREGIELMLTRAAAFYSDRSHPLGCLVMNEPQLTAQRALGHQTILEFLQSHEQELPAGTDPEPLADFYVAVARGLSAQARDGATETELRKVVGMAMAAWPKNHDPPSSRPT